MKKLFRTFHTMAAVDLMKLVTGTEVLQRLIAHEKPNMKYLQDEVKCYEIMQIDETFYEKYRGNFEAAGFEEVDNA